MQPNFDAERNRYAQASAKVAADAKQEEEDAEAMLAEAEARLFRELFREDAVEEVAVIQRPLPMAMMKKRIQNHAEGADADRATAVKILRERFLQKAAKAKEDLEVSRAV